MKNHQSKPLLHQFYKPLKKKNDRPNSKKTASSEDFIHPWQTPLGFAAKKKKKFSERAPGEPRICNHYF